MQSTRAFVFLTALAMAAVPCPVVAQSQVDTGSRIAIPKRAEIPETGTEGDQALIVMRQFARCTYAHNASGVAQAVMLEPGLDGEALNRLAIDDCLQYGTMKFSPALFRGALFGELYRRRSKGGGKPWTLPVEAFSVSALPTQAASHPVRTNFFMLYLADCVHKVAPAEVEAVVSQPAASPAQKRAFSTVIPLLGPCVFEGMTLKLNRMTLEHAFAEYLYRARPLQAIAAVEPR